MGREWAVAVSFANKQDSTPVRTCLQMPAQPLWVPEPGKSPAPGSAPEHPTAQHRGRSAQHKQESPASPGLRPALLQGKRNS